ncbi:MAG: prepilin-type N-terminal cleavage/methylation domain-containing protein [bacterium]
MLKSIKNNNSGITILEVAVALAVLLIGILAVAKIFPLSIKINQAADQGTVAINLAQAEMEQVFAMSYDNILPVIEAKHTLASTTDNPFYFYSREAKSEFVNIDTDGNMITPATDTGLKKITVSVYYKNQASNAIKKTDLIMLISKK